MLIDKFIETEELETLDEVDCVCLILFIVVMDWSRIYHDSE